MDLTQTPIVFLHIPKTAGQTLHNSLSRVLTARRVSPIRVHTQVPTARDQYPTGYSLYSGHLDWTALDHLPAARFVFTVLRDPGERIASFYFYLRRQAAGLDAASLQQPDKIGMNRALHWSPDDYFFGGDDAWQTFVRSHYDNFYCSYFATRRMLGWAATRAMTDPDLLAHARAGLHTVNAVYSTRDMAQIEGDFQSRFQMALALTDRYDNTSGAPAGDLRWPRLLASFGSDRAVEQMQSFIRLDQTLTTPFL